MPEFTAVEYAVLAHLKCEGKSTIPAIAADLLLGLSEAKEAVLRLVDKGVMQKEGEIYSPSPLAMEIPLIEVRKTPTGALGRLMRLPAAAAPAFMPTPSPDVAGVFQQARERAKRERAL